MTAEAVSVVDSQVSTGTSPPPTAPVSEASSGRTAWRVAAEEAGR